MPSNLLQDHKTESGNSVSTATTAESAKTTPNFEFPAKNNDTIPLNLSKPRRSEEPNNNKEQDIITPVSPSLALGFEEELNNLEMLRKRKYFLDNKFGGGPSPLFPPMGPLKSADYGAAAAAAAKLHPG